MPEYPPGETFLYWLGVAAREMREQAGVSMVAVAAALGMNTTKGVERFERAEHFPNSLEWTLAAYGQELGIDSREIVARALELWYDNGEAPSMSPADAMKAAQDAAQQMLIKSAESQARERSAKRAGRARKTRGGRKRSGAS